MAPLELKVIIVPIMQLAPMATDRTCANVKMDSLVMDLHAMVSLFRYFFKAFTTFIIKVSLDDYSKLESTLAFNLTSHTLFRHQRV